jgi:5-formyltetrahydrofolate cyclo-ligase
MEAFSGHSCYRNAESLAVYAACRGEVATEDLIRRGLAEGKAVLLPRVEHHGLVFKQIREDSELSIGAFGIREPVPGGRSWPPGEVDVFVIPGVAFDMAGRRIGYGKGYYDQALHELEGSGKLVGFCYEFQLVDEIAGEPHDVAMDLIITEERIVVPSLHPYIRES